MIQVISGGRQTGRTQKLIQMSALAHAKGETVRIVCHTQAEAERIKKLAFDQNLEIPDPVAYHTYEHNHTMRAKTDGYLIDNLEMVMYKVRAVVVCDD